MPTRPRPSQAHSTHCTARRGSSGYTTQTLLADVAACAARSPMQRQPADERRPRAAEGRADDDDVALQQHRADGADNGEQDHDQHVRLDAGAPPEHRGEHRAERRADQHDAEEVRQVQDERANHAADHRGQMTSDPVFPAPTIVVASSAPRMKP